MRGSFILEVTTLLRNIRRGLSAGSILVKWSVPAMSRRSVERFYRVGRQLEEHQREPFLGE